MGQAPTHPNEGHAQYPFAAPDGGRITVFLGITSHQRPPRVSGSFGQWGLPMVTKPGQGLFKAGAIGASSAALFAIAVIIFNQGRPGDWWDLLRWEYYGRAASILVSHAQWIGLACCLLQLFASCARRTLK
jgi:hypothetical protein